MKNCVVKILTKIRILKNESTVYCVTITKALKSILYMYFELYTSDTGAIDILGNSINLTQLDFISGQLGFI